MQGLLLNTWFFTFTAPSVKPQQELVVLSLVQHSLQCALLTQCQKEGSPAQSLRKVMYFVQQHGLNSQVLSALETGSSASYYQFGWVTSPSAPTLISADNLCF